MTKAIVYQVAPVIMPSLKSDLQRLIEGVRLNSPLLYSIDDLYKHIMLGHMQLWMAHFEGERPHLCMITQLVEHDQGKVCHILIIAGSQMRSVMHLRKDFEQWAMMQGCQYISGSMRPKLQRLLVRYGYHTTALTVYKSLSVMH